MSLYINHDRDQPVPGDVVRDEDSDHRRTWHYSIDYATRTAGWSETIDHTVGAARPNRLRLLVDGETGQVVR